MSSTATSADADADAASPTDVDVAPGERLGVLFEQLSKLTGQRNAIDGRIVDIIAEIDRDELWGTTGARSVTALVAWKTGSSHANAAAIAAVAHRLESFPRCAQGMREGRLSLDQVGLIASRAGDGSDEHYAQLAAVATVNQLRTAIKLEPRPDPGPRPDQQPSIAKTSDDAFDFWRITLPHAESAILEAALQSHRDALVVDWKRDRTAEGAASDQPPPMPSTVDAFMRLVETGWDGEVQRRPHGQRTTVVVHLDVEQKIGALHLGPLLPDSERRYLTCEATCEVWFEPRRRSDRLRPLDPHHQSPAAPRAGAPPPQLRGTRLRRHPRSARPPHQALGKRRRDRAAQPGAAVPLSPPIEPPRRHHHHRTS
jgi:hypothetical protein